MQRNQLGLSMKTCNLAMYKHACLLLVTLSLENPAVFSWEGRHGSVPGLSAQHTASYINNCVYVTFNESSKHRLYLGCLFSM